jgi:hypothetical protein
MRICNNCGKWFQKRLHVNSAGLFCGRNCSFAWKKDHGEAAVSYPVPVTNGSTHRRRAKRFNVKYENIKARDVFERDLWICGLCNEPVDKLAIHPQPDAATLDHIIPMSKGGCHVVSNVQCAHWACNAKKGDSITPGAINK